MKTLLNKFKRKKETPKLLGGSDKSFNVRIAFETTRDPTGRYSHRVNPLRFDNSEIYDYVNKLKEDNTNHLTKHPSANYVHSTLIIKYFPMQRSQGNPPSVVQNEMAYQGNL